MTNHKLGDRNKCACGAKSTVSKWLVDRWVSLCMPCRMKLVDGEGNVVP